MTGKLPKEGSAPLEGVQATTVYEDKTIQFTGGEYSNEEIHYRLMKPTSVEPNQKYPLVIFLHGAGERGDR